MNRGRDNGYDPVCEVETLRFLFGASRTSRSGARSPAAAYFPANNTGWSCHAQVHVGKGQVPRTRDWAGHLFSSTRPASCFMLRCSGRFFFSAPKHHTDIAIQAQFSLTSPYRYQHVGNVDNCRLAPPHAGHPLPCSRPRYLVRHRLS